MIQITQSFAGKHGSNMSRLQFSIANLRSQLCAICATDQSSDRWAKKMCEAPSIPSPTVL